MWRLDSGRQAALWWLALALMVLDHAAALYWPELPALRLPGRVVLPVLGLLVAYNLTARGVQPGQYLTRLAPFAAIAQLPYLWAFGMDAPLNILVTLGLGVLSTVRTAHLPAFAFIGVAVAVALVVPVEYGVPGVLLVPVACWFLQAVGPSRLLRLAGLVALVLALNAYSLPLAFAGVGGVALVGAAQFLPPMPRAPRWFGYGFYPLHLAVLVLVRTLV